MSDADTTAPRASSAYDQHVARRPPDHVLGRRAENGTRHVAGAGASDNDDVRVGIAACTKASAGSPSAAIISGSIPRSRSAAAPRSRTASRCSADGRSRIGSSTTPTDSSCGLADKRMTRPWSPASSAARSSARSAAGDPSNPTTMPRIAHRVPVSRRIPLAPTPGQTTSRSSVRSAEIMRLERASEQKFPGSSRVEPTGFEPVTSCLQSRRSKAVFPAKPDNLHLLPLCAYPLHGLRLVNDSLFAEAVLRPRPHHSRESTLRPLRCSGGHRADSSGCRSPRGCFDDEQAGRGGRSRR